MVVTAVIAIVVDHLVVVETATGVEFATVCLILLLLLTLLLQSKLLLLSTKHFPGKK